MGEDRCPCEGYGLLGIEPLAVATGRLTSNMVSGHGEISFEFLPAIVHATAVIHDVGMLCQPSHRLRAMDRLPPFVSLDTAQARLPHSIWLVIRKSWSLADGCDAESQSLSTKVAILFNIPD